MEVYCCKNCKCEFRKYAAQVKNINNVFCSKKCFDDYRRFGEIEKECKRCGSKWIAQGAQSKEYRRKFCSNDCKNEHYSELYKGKSRNNSKGWRKTTQGYVVIKKPNHHRADKAGYVKRMILVMEEKIGRNLTQEEVVHHIDKDKSNDSPENLMLFASNSEHISYHYYVLGEQYISKNSKKSKLSKDQIVEIRRMYLEETQNKSKIARKFDVSSNTIADIISHKRKIYDL